MEQPVVASSTIAWLAFALGVVFGAVGNKTHFCTLGAVSDVVNMGDWRRMRMWMLAIAVAIIGTGALQLAGLVDVSKSIYTGSRLRWLSHVLGGLAFGVGMTLASGCGSKTLIRLGGGNLKSLVVFVFLGLAASMTLRGVFGVWRVQWLDSMAVELDSAQHLPALLAAGGMAPERALLLATAAVGGLLLATALAHRDAWRADILLGGTVVGLLVVGGWYVSGHIGYVAEHPETLEEAFIGTNSGRAESFSFVAPLAYTLELLMFWSDASRIVTFGIAGALGVVVGSALLALTTRSFRIESFRDAGDLIRHLLGAVLMGFGGVTALGCTIGQGVSGISALSLGSMLTTLSIIAGAALTMKVQYWLLLRNA